MATSLVILIGGCVMDVKSVCNDVKQMNKLVKTMLELAVANIKRQGVNPLIVETYRPQARQDYLYCQGRTIAEVTEKGISSVFAKTYCNPKADKVTWTLDSVHKSRKAVDVVPQRLVNGKMKAIWNANDPQTLIIIKTMEKYGFEAGAKWENTPDSSHFQVKGTFTTVFNQANNTMYVTKVIQQALISKVSNVNLEVDGYWSVKTTEAVNKFRKMQGYKTAFGQIGADAFMVLLK